MAVIFLRDERVTGSENISAEINMLVRASDDIGSKLSELADQINSNFSTAGFAWGNYLHVLCHGMPEGLQLGTAPAINHNSIRVFSVLRGRVGHIIVHGCSAAFVYPNGNNGRLMCSRLAIAVNAAVTAADATQFYQQSSSIHNLSNGAMLTNWRGNVGTWNERGQLVNVSTEENRRAGMALPY